MDSLANLVQHLQGPPVILNFEGRRVRFVGTQDKPEWVAQDVCDVVGIENASQALTNFDEDEKGIHITYTLGGKQRYLTVYEAGLYRLIFKSRKPDAKRFQKWVFSQGERIKSYLSSRRRRGFPRESRGFERPACVCGECSFRRDGA